MEERKAEIQSILSKGEFIDPHYDGDCYVTVITFRINGQALNEWIWAKIWQPHDYFPTNVDWENYVIGKIGLTAKWEEEIIRLLGYDISDDRSYVLTQNVSEIFTLVIFDLSKEEKENV